MKVSGSLAAAQRWRLVVAVRPQWQLGGSGNDGCLAAQAAAWWQWW
jgi:hypothetical protein